jgi:hypothetical protein
LEKDIRTSLVAPCGIDCGICELYTCKDNPAQIEAYASRGIPREKLPCPGCRGCEGECPVIGERCATYSCVSSKGHRFCYECEGFPCAMLNPAADRAPILPHNTKVFNLCTIRRVGVEGFVSLSSDIKQKYYKGKMQVGKGPQLG